jgi:hypothetical protein
MGGKWTDGAISEPLAAPEVVDDIVGTPFTTRPWTSPVAPKS